MEIKGSGVRPQMARAKIESAPKSNISQEQTDTFRSGSNSWDDFKGTAQMLGIWAGVASPLVLGTVGGAIHGYYRGGLATAAWQGAAGMLIGGVGTGAMVLKLIEGAT